jgi:hypothetical protein
MANKACVVDQTLLDELPFGKMTGGLKICKAALSLWTSLSLRQRARLSGLDIEPSHADCQDESRSQRRPRDEPEEKMRRPLMLAESFR